MYPHIRDLREDNEKTQQELATYLHVSQTTYSRYETGQLDIPTQILKQLAAYYRVTIDYLLETRDESC